MFKDFQRKKVYRAEADAGIRITPKLNLYTARTYVSECLQAEPLLRYYPHVRYAGVPALEAGRRHAWGSRKRLLLPEWALCKGVVLHELTHFILLTHPVWEDEPHHGGRFCATQLRLWKWFLPEWSDGLEWAFNKWGVIFT